MPMRAHCGSTTDRMYAAKCANSCGVGWNSGHQEPLGRLGGDAGDDGEDDDACGLIGSSGAWRWRDAEEAEPARRGRLEEGEWWAPPPLLLARATA